MTQILELQTHTCFHKVTFYLTPTAVDLTDPNATTLISGINFVVVLVIVAADARCRCHNFSPLAINS